MMDLLSASKCLYGKNCNADNPHRSYSRKSPRKIFPDILHVIGNTPLVKLNRIPQSLGIECDIYAKCEFQNPGGSIKDRTAVSMIEDAEKSGLLKPGGTIIELTNGNTGIGLAMVSAVKGYKCIIVVPETTSTEKRDILKSLGAQVIIAPDALAAIPICVELEKTIPNGIILNQMRNPQNPLAHYSGTALEIFDQCGGHVDMVVIGVGSGGTLTGIGRKLKELVPSCLIVGADPLGSPIAEPPSLNKTDVTHTEVEGIGLKLPLPNLDKSVVDFWVKVDDESSFEMARRLHKEEGILCGASSGCLMSGAIQAAKQLKAGQRCVVMFSDGAVNYLSKFVSDYWMESKNFIPRHNKFNHWWWNKKVSELPLKPYISIPPTTTCKATADIFNDNRLDIIPCINDEKLLQGIVYAQDLISKLLNNTVSVNDLVTKVLSKKYRTVTSNSNLGELSHIFEKEQVAIVIKEEGKDLPNCMVTGVLFAAELLSYITSG